MADINKRTKRELQEAYEDFLFKNVMAIYTANESAEIEKEAAEIGRATAKDARKLFDKKERKENIKAFLNFGKKAFLAVASVAFVAVVSLYGAMIVSADVRKAVADTVYSFAYDSWGNGTFIKIENPTITDAEWKPLYKLSYIPEGLIEGQNDSYYYGFSYSVYRHSEKYYTDGVNNLIFAQFSPSTEIDEYGDYDDKKKVQIKNSEGLFLRQEGKYIRIIWSTNDTILGIAGDFDEETMLKIARSVIGGVYGEEDDTEYIYDDTYSYPTEALKLYENPNIGKVGLVDALGTAVVPAMYDDITDEMYYFILHKEDGTYMAPELVGYRYKMTEQTKHSYTVYFPDGTEIGPFEKYIINGMIDEFAIIGVIDGSYYEYKYANGELTVTYSDEKTDAKETAFGYTVTKRYYDFGSFKGLVDKNGNEVLPPISRDVQIISKDRAVCVEGHSSFYQGIECGHAYIYDLTTGEVINSDFNKITYTVLDEGYIGVAFASDYYGEDMYEAAKAAGIENLPCGVWLVDKDGNMISERYERIYYLDGEWENDFYYSIDNTDLVLFGRKPDGTVEEFTLKDILIPYE